jgi:hypothetical protein
MIPKKIHYCWFGNSEIPAKDKKCIESWKKYCPDYEIIQWNESNYDVTKNEYMQQAYAAKKWGFVPDYARLDIIYEHGGIYLDTDVELVKNLDELLVCEAFMGFEDGKHVSPGLCIASEAKNSTIRKLMDIYATRKFVKPDGTLDLTPSPIMNTDKLLEMGLKQDNRKQVVAGITIFPKECFCPKDYYTGKLSITDQTYGIHWFNASWQTPHQKRMLKVRRVLGDNLYFKLVDMKNIVTRKKRRNV